MRLPLIRHFGIFLLLAGLLSNFLPVATIADRNALSAARSDLVALFGDGVALCAPGLAGGDSDAPLHQRSADCILCCLSQPCRSTPAVLAPLVPLPRVARVATPPWPALSPLLLPWDATEQPYRPRAPPIFG